MPLRRPRSPRPLVLLPGAAPQIQKYTPSQSSCLKSPPSPTSLRAIPRTPLTPPARLHFRTVLPSSPLSPQFVDSAPDIPCSWIWRCHKCGSHYSLGVTRRCLYDGHFFCSVPPPREETRLSEDEDEDESDGGESSIANERQTQRKRSKSRRGRRRAVGCISEFDYSGWEEYNSWRRCVKIYKYEKAQKLRRPWKRVSSEDEDEKEGMDDYQLHKNCWDDCDYPSECNNNRLQEELERRHLEDLFSETCRTGGSDTEVDSESEEEEAEWEFKGKVMQIEEWEAEEQKQKLAAFEKEEVELDEMKFAVAIYGDVPSVSSSSDPSSSHSSLSTTTSSQSEEKDVVDMERRGVEGSAEMVDVSLGPLPPAFSSSLEVELEDDDLFMSEFATKRRKKSIQKIAQLTGLMLGVEPVERGYEEEKPRSPLKDGFKFWEFDDVPLVDREAERDIEEEERRGSLFRRKGGGE